jgi:Tol biopolymer transport system component
MRWVAVVVALLLAPSTALAQGAKPQTKSLDSEAPPGSPPHWLPNETWVMQHWLPYDETRLYSLLGVDRGDIWRWLRDDTRNLAGLAALHGWDAHDLARELVAPWRGKLREPGRLALLESRALRTLTQGHLSQHIFFHSLHQDAIPNAAPAIFGTSTTRFRYLRRSELSPLMICRLNGKSRSHAQAAAEQTLRDMVARGVRGQAIPAAQAQRLLARQLRQVPRWLQQTRYNGPPPLKQPRGSIATASNYSNNAAFAADGVHFAYESYEAKLAVAKSRGEISVVAGDGRTSIPVRLSPDRGPTSAYNPAISRDGRFVAFEAAAGNLNFAKRYGQMGVWVRDVRTGRTVAASSGASRAPFSAYNPSISGDGRRVAFETSDSATGALSIWVAERGRRAQRIERPIGATSDLYEPALSADGRFLAFTTVDGVFLRDLSTRETAKLAGGDAWDPVVSAHGERVAFTRGARVVVEDVATGAEHVVVPPDASFASSEPSLSADGTRVAFTARGAGEGNTAVFVTDLATGTTELASRASGAAGPPAFGGSAHPSISADGKRVAFTSDAYNLSPAKCNPARGIFVRDLATARTTLVSSGDGLNRGIGPTKGSGGESAMRIALLCAGAQTPSSSSEL